MVRMKTRILIPFSLIADVPFDMKTLVIVVRKEKVNIGNGCRILYNKIWNLNAESLTDPS